MSAPHTAPPDNPAFGSTGEAVPDDEIRAREPRNLLVLALHVVVLRVAWIFKTESVIMPAFLDTIAGAGWLRGCLPVLSRFGQSVPPLMFAEKMRHTPLKKRALFATTLLMGAPFLVLSALWFALDEKRHWWFPPLFLALYAFFFSVTGLRHLAFGTVQGKLIRPHRRGRLMALAGTLGAVAAIACAWFLLARWLAVPDNPSGGLGGFGYIFGFTGIGFAVSALLTMTVREPADGTPRRRDAPRNFLKSGWQVFRDDADFRKIAVVAALFMSVQLLFPHYQALGRSPGSTTAGNVGFHLMLWVVVQNAGMALFSLLGGMLADRRGYRLTVRLAIFGAALPPLLALVLTSEYVADGRSLFWLTYFLLGLVPVTMRSFTNYALEIADPDDHPRYIGTLKLAMAVPFLLSPLVGLLVDVVGFPPVFLSITGLIFVAGLLTFHLAEPRFE